MKLQDFRDLFRYSFFALISAEFWCWFQLILEPCSVIFCVFSRSICCWIFDTIFYGHWTKKDSQNSCPELSFFSSFPPCSEDRFLYVFWSPLGSMLAPFWLPLPPFWLPLAPFWHHLAPFWIPLPPFWLSLVLFWFPNLWKNFLFGTLSAKHPKTIPRTLTFAPHRP